MANDDWNQWAKYVLEELKHLKSSDTKVYDELKAMEMRIQEKLSEFWKIHMQVQLQVNELKTKAAILGAIVGLAGGIIGSTIGQHLLLRLLAN